MSLISEQEGPFPVFCGANFQIGPSYFYVSSVKTGGCKSVSSSPAFVLKPSFSPKCVRSVLMYLNTYFNSG